MLSRSFKSQMRAKAAPRSSTIVCVQPRSMSVKSRLSIRCLPIRALKESRRAPSLSRSSTRLRSVMSKVIPVKRTALPASSRSMRPSPCNHRSPLRG